MGRVLTWKIGGSICRGRIFKIEWGSFVQSSGHWPSGRFAMTSTVSGLDSSVCRATWATDLVRDRSTSGLLYCNCKARSEHTTKYLVNYTKHRTFDCIKLGSNKAHIVCPSSQTLLLYPTNVVYVSPWFRKYQSLQYLRQLWWHKGHKIRCWSCLCCLRTGLPIDFDWRCAPLARVLTLLPTTLIAKSSATSIPLLQPSSVQIPWETPPWESYWRVFES